MYIFEPGPKRKIARGSQICLCTVNVGGFNPNIWQSNKRDLLTKPSRWSWREESSQKNSSCATLETYDKMPISPPVNIMEDSVESVAQKCWGSYGPGGTDSEDLQGWILKFGEYRKRLRTSVDFFSDWLSNKSLPWAAYCTFMSVRLILFDKSPGICPVRVGEIGNVFLLILC